MLAFVVDVSAVHLVAMLQQARWSGYIGICSSCSRGGGATRALTSCDKQ
jgi:hypothetical protein